MNLPLNIRIADANIEFDRPTPIRMLATSTFRGLFGYALKETYPQLFDDFFKPGANSNIPVPFAIAPMDNPPSPSNYLKFKIITFDPSGEVIAAFDNTAQFCVGRNFGTSGAKIKSCSFSPGSWYESIIPTPLPQKISINFVSPVSFKYNGKKVVENNFTLPLLIYAVYNTFSKLCKHYSVNEQRPSLPKWPDVLGNSFVQKNNLTWVSPKRYSSSQETTLNLSGMVGNIIIPYPTETLLRILNIAALTGIGKNTVHGCGRITWHRISE